MILYCEELLVIRPPQWYNSMVTSVVDQGLMPSEVKQMTIKLVFANSWLSIKEYEQTDWFRVVCKNVSEWNDM